MHYNSKNICTIYFNYSLWHNNIIIIILIRISFYTHYISSKNIFKAFYGITDEIYCGLDKDRLFCTKYRMQPIYLELVYLVTALVPSDTACLANSPGNKSLTAVWISREVMVDLLL